MKEFDSILGFVEHLAVMAVEERRELHHALDKAAKLVEDTAHAALGHYQGEAGQFVEWAPLAPATLAHHERMGVGDTPLYITGELNQSISREVDGMEAIVGSTSDVMVYQELGTPTIPPRAVMGPSALRNEETIRSLIGEAAVRGLLYGSGEAMVLLEG